MKKMIIGVFAMAASLTAVAADQAVVDRYNAACKTCHQPAVAPAMGSPAFGSAADWEPRLAKGMDTLVAHVTNGFNNMPPRGMCMDCSPEEYKALIEYMSTGE